VISIQQWPFLLLISENSKHFMATTPQSIHEGIPVKNWRIFLQQSFTTTWQLSDGN